MKGYAYVSRVKAESFIRKESKGRYFGVYFIKKDGKARILNARLGIKSNGNGRKTIGKPSDSYLVVYSNNDQGYRAVNLNSLVRFTMNGVNYLVTE